MSHTFKLYFGIQRRYTDCYELINLYNIICEVTSSAHKIYKNSANIFFSLDDSGSHKARVDHSDVFSIILNPDFTVEVNHNVLFFVITVFF